MISEACPSTNVKDTFKIVAKTFANFRFTIKTFLQFIWINWLVRSWFFFLRLVNEFISFEYFCFKVNWKNKIFILHVRNSHGFFVTNFRKKRYLRSKTEKKEHHHWILHIRISLSTKFQYKLIIFISWTKFAQKSIPSQNRKSEQHFWILNIPISLNNKFHFKQKILNYGTKFAQKAYFRSKTGKNNITVVFRISKLV